MKISVIIPTLNEEKVIAGTLEDLLVRQGAEEVIVVDGGSSDQTVRVASKWAKVISSARGRPRQLNAGARESEGKIFLFLHADTALPEKGLQKIKRAIEEGNRAGRFRMRFDDPHWLLRVYSSYTRFHLFSYGDQGFFVTRKLFWELGGYREDVPFEDVDFYARLRKKTRPVILSDSVVTSARRFAQAGLIRQKLINISLVSLHALGYDVYALKEKFYRSIR